MAKDGFVTKTYLDQKLSTFKEELYEIKDEIVGEIKAVREEFQTHQFFHARINDELQSHSARITKLETSSPK